jgi:hypothetical protein
LLQHGTGKILGFPAVPAFAHVQIGSLAGLGGMIKLIGGIRRHKHLANRLVPLLLCERSRYFLWRNAFPESREAIRIGFAK